MAAIEAHIHIALNCGDAGSAATWVLRAVVSGTRAGTLGGSVGELLRLTAEATLASAMALGKCVGKLPDVDGMQSDVLQCCSS